MSFAEILALDVATTTGWARGVPGETPTCGSIRFGARDASHNAILAACFDWLVEATRERRPDILVVEDLLPFGAARGRTTKKTGDLLGALHGVVRLVAFKRAIFNFHAVSANDVRGHFIDGRSYKRADAKRYVLAQCRKLGWPAEDEDAADACALWHFWCARINPMTALQVSPLFNKAIA
jgi:hypothetical protein